jgi:hypothetical protein
VISAPIKRSFSTQFAHSRRPESKTGHCRLLMEVASAPPAMRSIRNGTTQ